MKLLIVSQYYWPENFRINDLAEALNKRGHEVTVLTGKPNYPSGSFYSGYGILKRNREQLNGIDIIRVPLFPRGSSSSIRLILNYLSFALFATIIAPFRCRGTYDLIFAYQLSPITAAIPAVVMRFIKRVPMMLWVQDLWPESLSATGAIKSPIILSAVKSLVAKIYHHSDRVLVQSEAFVAPAVTSGADPDRISYFPNWAEDLYCPIVLPLDAPERNELPKGFSVMFAGNLGAAQSLETIIDAASRLKASGIHWIILGDGRRAAWMRGQIHVLGLEHCVHMLGRKPMELMPRYFSLANVLLATLRPDPIFAATIPGKVQSYLASGRPIIAALDGEGARVVEDSGAGYAVPAGDGEALAEAVERMSKLKADELDNMGSAAIRYYDENFAKEHAIDQLEAWMSDLTVGE